MKARALVCSAVAAMLVGGCGEGDTTTVVQAAPEQPAATKPEPSGPSKAEFIEQADAICGDFNAQLEDFPRANAAYYATIEESNDKLRALEVPRSLRIPFDQYMGAVEDQLAATRANDGQEFKQADARKEDAAQHIGFAECGTG